jgi:sugar/nucleoside kinase (ribokinase family)
MKIDVVGGVFRDLLFYGNKHSEDFIEIPGGTGYNVFIGLRTLGFDVQIHASVGKDWPFEFLDTFKIVKGQKSGVFVDLNENEVLAVYRGANLFTEYEALHSNVLFSSLECGGKVFEEYSKKVKASQGVVILDPSPIFEWKESYLELCDYLLPNAEEYVRIFKGKQVPPGIKIFEKLGSKGGAYITKEKKHLLPTHFGGNFALGCGDAFDVAVVNGILKSKEPLEILRTAIQTGSAASLVRGSSTAVVKAVTKIK